MQSQRIIMNFTTPPSLEDVEDLANAAWENLPEELSSRCDELTIAVEDTVDDTTMDDLDVDDAYELLALYKNGKEISPGVERKVANDDDVLVIYRRPVLDMWCETQDDLLSLIRQIMIEELGRHFEFSDDYIVDMAERHYQALF